MLEKMTKMHRHGSYWFVTISDGEQSRLETFVVSDRVGTSLTKRAMMFPNDAMAVWSGRRKHFR